MFDSDEDDDGERITVRGDEELQAMISFVSYLIERLLTT